MKKSTRYREDLHYLKDARWLSGELCYWSNNSNYSQKTKEKLEKRLREMISKSKQLKNGPLA
jgi:hypothetical protein